MELFRRRVKEEMEDERDQYQKDLAERDFTIDQTRQKYQAELLQISEGELSLRELVPVPTVGFRFATSSGQYQQFARRESQDAI